MAQLNPVDHDIEQLGRWEIQKEDNLYELINADMTDEEIEEINATWVSTHPIPRIESDKSDIDRRISELSQEKQQLVDTWIGQWRTIPKKDKKEWEKMYPRPTLSVGFEKIFKMKKEKTKIQSLESLRSRFDMSDLLESIDEEDPPEFADNVPDKKTVYILVAMHGEPTKTDIRDTNIEVEIYSVDPGKCGLLHGHIETELKRIQRYQHIGLVEKMQVIEEYKREHLMFREPKVKELIKEHTISPTPKQTAVLASIHPGTSLDKIQELYQTSTPIQKRKAVFDTTYSIDETFPLSSASGIYVLATSYDTPELLKPADLTIDDRHVSGMLTHLKLPSSPENIALLKHHLETIKSMNLLHIETMQAFSRKIKGTPDIILPDPYTKTKRDEMGSLQYKSLSLSRLLVYFKRLGFEKVVLLDDSCRAGFSISTPFKFMRSLESTEDGSLDPVVKRMGDPRKGGTKRRRTRRKRSRRFHKKS